MNGDNLLPHQLRRQANSHLEKRLQRSIEMVERESAGWHSHTSQTKDLLQDLCPQYKPCSCETGCVLCESGKHVVPFRGKTCVNCIASQLTKDGKWDGPEDAKSSVRTMTLKERYIASRVKPLTKI